MTAVAAGLGWPIEARPPAGLPAWFRDPRRTLVRPETRECETCGAPPGETCRYTAATNGHWDAEAGCYVDNVIGEPMRRSHKGR